MSTTVHMPVVLEAFQESALFFVCFTPIVIALVKKGIIGNKLRRVIIGGNFLLFLYLFDYVLGSMCPPSDYIGYTFSLGMNGVALSLINCRYKYLYKVVYVDMTICWVWVVYMNI